MNEIPKNWIKCELGEIAQLKNGYAFKSESYQSEGTAVIRISDINDGIVRSDYCVKVKYQSDFDNFIVRYGDILIAMSGATTGKFGIYNSKQQALQNQRVGNLKPFSENLINKKFLYYFLFSAKREIEKSAYGGAQPNISSEKVENINFSLPPLNEQKRIVSKIEELFSMLDKGIENLKTAREQLKIYRQAVLKHAFEGKLTADWREKNKAKLETADQLLNRMKVMKYKSEDLPSLPQSWIWIKSGSLFSMVTSGSRGWAKHYSKSGALFIRIGNMDFDSLVLDFSDLQYVSPPSNAEGIRTKVEEGDFLFSITGYLGMFAIAPKLSEAYVNQHIALARPLEGFNKEYVGYYITSKTGGHYYLNGLTKGAVKAGLRLDDIRSFPIPMCSLAEQGIIVEQLKKKLSIIENIEQTISLELKKSEALRQAILKKAFSGQLVAQEPKDEPASTLLARIRAEKEALKPTPKKKRAA